MRALLGLVVVVLACGRTAPEDEVLAPPETGVVEPRVEPLLVSFDEGLLEARRLDASVAFSARLIEPRRFVGATFLESVGGVIGWGFNARDASGSTTGYTGRAGDERFRGDGPVPPWAWVDASGAVVPRVLWRGQAVQPLLLRATAGGHLAVVDAQRRLGWATPSTGNVRETGLLVGADDYRISGERLYLTTRAGLVESSAAGDVTVPSPFPLQVLVSANAVRQVLIVDPVRQQLAVVHFESARVDSVRLENGGFPPAAPAMDGALHLDDQGRVYATFISRTALVVFRTATLGQTWERFAEVPTSTGATAVELTRTGRLAVVSGVVLAGPLVSAAVSTTVVSVDDLRAQALPLGRRQLFSAAKSPVAVSSDGVHIAFWAVEGDELRLRAIDFGSGASVDLQTKPSPKGAGAVTLPKLAWLDAP